jgi:hypothetical protein
MNKILMCTTIILMVVLALFSGSASADVGKGTVKTTLSEASNQPADTLLAGPGLEEGFSPPPPARKCRWVKVTNSVSNSSIVTALMPTVLENRCGSGFVSVGSGVHVTSLPEHSFTSSRLVCDD